MPAFLAALFGLANDVPLPGEADVSGRYSSGRVLGLSVTFASYCVTALEFVLVE